LKVGRSSRAGFAPIWRRSRTSIRPCDGRAALIAHLWARSNPRRPIDPADRGLLRSPTTDGGRCRHAEVGARIDQVVVAVGAVLLLESATSRVSGDHLARFGRLVRTEVLTLDVTFVLSLIADVTSMYSHPDRSITFPGFLPSLDDCETLADDHRAQLHLGNSDSRSTNNDA
jgi:hypothetical protein